MVPIGRNLDAVARAGTPAIAAVLSMGHRPPREIPLEQRRAARLAKLRDDVAAEEHPDWLAYERAVEEVLRWDGKLVPPPKPADVARKGRERRASAWQQAAEHFDAYEQHREAAARLDADQAPSVGALRHAWREAGEALMDLEHRYLQTNDPEGRLALRPMIRSARDHLQRAERRYVEEGRRGRAIDLDDDSNWIRLTGNKTRGTEPKDT